jgi:chlorite dismutase
VHAKKDLDVAGLLPGRRALHFCPDMTAYMARTALESPQVPGFHIRMFTVFRGGQSGAWRVTRFAPVKGAALSPTPSLSVVHTLTIALPILPSPTSWRLAGVASHLRYTERAEKTQLDAERSEIGRPEATHAALIPIKKSAAWWELTQEERRQIFEDRSHHIASSLKYLPTIARQLYHSRDLGEPFDFLTWFEYAPADANAFEELVGTLRATEEWRHVEREVDIRMERERLDAG